MVMRRILVWTAVLFVLFIWHAVDTRPLHAATVVDGDILGLGRIDIVRIEIEQGDLVTILERGAEGWNVLAPVQDRANQEAVQELLARLTRLTIADVLGEDHPAYGFNPPRATIRVTGAGGQVRELLIGNLRSPVSLFVKNAAENTVYAVSNVTLARIGEYPMGFVDGTLLRIDSSEGIQEIQVQRIPPLGAEEEPVNFTVRRSGDGWTFDTGAVAFDVDDFFRAARLIQATGRLADDESTSQRFYPAPGTTRIVIGYADGQRTVVDVGLKSADGHHYYVKVSGRDDIYLVPGFHAEHLINQATAINDSLINFDSDFVKQLRIKVGADGREVVFDKNRNGDWESNRAVVFGFIPLLEAIASVGAERLVSTNQDDPAFGFGVAPDAIEVLMTFNDNNTLGLSIGGSTDDGAGVYLKTTMRPGVYVGRLSDAQAVANAAQAVRTQLFPAKANEIASIRVQRGDLDFTLEAQENGWVKAGASVAADPVQRLITALDGLSADSLPPLPDDPAALGFYPAGSGVRITVTYKDGVERALDIGAGVQVGSGWFATTSYYASVSDLDVVAFVKEQSVRTIQSAIDALK